MIKVYEFNIKRNPMQQKNQSEYLEDFCPGDLIKAQMHTELAVYLRENIQNTILIELGSLFFDAVMRKYWIDRWCVKLFGSKEVYLTVCYQAANLVYLNLMDSFELDGRDPREVIKYSFDEFLLICLRNALELSAEERRVFFTKEHNSNLTAWLDVSSINSIASTWAANRAYWQE